MAYLIGVLLAVALLVALVSKGRKRSTTTEGNLKNTVPGTKKEPPASRPQSTATSSRVKDTTPAGSQAKRSQRSKSGGPQQPSLDESYARTHNLWVCPHCETLNESAVSTCQACGAHK